MGIYEEYDYEFEKGPSFLDKVSFKYHQLSSKYESLRKSIKHGASLTGNTLAFCAFVPFGLAVGITCDVLDIREDSKGELEKEFADFMEGLFKW